MIWNCSAALHPGTVWRRSWVRKSEQCTDTGVLGSHRTRHLLVKRRYTFPKHHTLQHRSSSAMLTLYHSATAPRSSGVSDLLHQRHQRGSVRRYVVLPKDAKDMGRSRGFLLKELQRRQAKKGASDAANMGPERHQIVCTGRTWCFKRTGAERTTNLPQVLPTSTFLTQPQFRVPS